jgi:hypothetical protein
MITPTSPPKYRRLRHVVILFRSNNEYRDGYGTAISIGRFFSWSGLTTTPLENYSKF